MDSPVLEEAVQRGFAVFIPRGFQDQSGENPEQPHLTS